MPKRMSATPRLGRPCSRQKGTIIRIGIDYRIISVGASFISRGMGRYTQQQLREVLKLDTQTEYVLFCDPDSDLGLILPEVRQAPNVSISIIEKSAERKASPNQPERVLRFAEEYQTWISKQGIDLYHATTPFLFNDTVIPKFDVCPMVATFYDVIPLIFPDRYLTPDIVPAELYGRAVDFTSTADWLVAISESSRRDAAAYLGFPLSRIDVAYPVPDPWFRVLPRGAVQSGLERLRSEMGLPDEFLMSVPGLHHSKNLDTLLAAYASLQPGLRGRLPLVLVFHVSDAERLYVQSLTDKLGITDNVLLTGLVAETELVALYNAAAIVVHPSRYEGFGLPVVEALKCGAPVVTTSVSSLPEAGGEAAVYVGPDDVQGIARAIEALYEDPARRQMMSQRGVEHVRKFDPPQLARNTLDAYTKAFRAARDADRGNRRPHIALWTPLPPQQSGVADYATDLLDELDGPYDVEVFIDDGYLPSVELLRHHKISHFCAFERRMQQSPFDATVYQLGGSRFHLYMYAPLRKWPGVVVLHDLVWSYALFAATQLDAERKEFTEELLRQEGTVALRDFEHILHEPPSLQWPMINAFLNSHPMLKEITDRSIALITHAEQLSREITSKYSPRKVYTVFHGAPDPWCQLPARNAHIARTRLGLKASGFVVGLFGIVDPVKRVDVCLKAFVRVLHDHPDARLLIIGPCDDAYRYQLQELAQALGVDSKVFFSSRVPRARFELYLLACDVVVNLRYPSRKQMSGTLVRAIAAGKPVIITDLPEWSHFPREFCWRVAPDDREVTVLARHLNTLAANPQLRQQMGEAAREYYHRELTIARMTAGYRRVIEDVTGTWSVPSEPVVEKERSVRMVNFNKVCELEDFSDPELVDTIRDVFRHEIPRFTPDFPRGAEYRKYWEVAMSVRALRHFKALHPDSVILGVGAGTEATLFYLTNHAKQVFACDMYLDKGPWDGFAPSLMLIEPEEFAPYEFPSARLVVQHMDGRILRYPDNTFDGIFSSGSIEHFGSLEYVANASYEMGRVLKPGGVLTLSTEFKITGPPEGKGLPGTLLFTQEELARYIVEASGLQPVDTFSTDLSDATLQTRRDIQIYIDEAKAQMAEQGMHPRAGEIIWSQYPHLILVAQGYVFGSVHLTLRKSDDYPAAPNSWAAPTQETAEAVRAATNKYLDSLVAPPVTPPPPPPQASAAPPPRSDTANLAHMHEITQRWEFIRNFRNDPKALRRMPALVKFLYRTILRIRRLGHVWAIQDELIKASLAQHATAESRLSAAEQTLASIPEIENRLRGFQDHSPQIADMQGRLVNMQSEIARIASIGEELRRVEELQDVVSQIGKTLQETDRSVSQYRTEMVQAQEARASESEEIRSKLIWEEQRIVQIAEGLDKIRDELARLDSIARQNTSSLRLVQYRTDTGATANGPAFPFTGGELAQLIGDLESEVDELRNAHSIDVSIQHISAESQLLAIAAHFGNRLSSTDEIYRAPNDVWYHIDFTESWNRPELLVNANSKLGPGGILVLVTDATFDDKVSGQGLTLTLDRHFEIGPSRVRIITLKREPA
jgi:glycosyltransferase involved in cell wall biosynthesis/SAM-dependent methyltransferase